MSISIEKIKELCEQIKRDPNEVYNLEPDEAVEVRKYMNPFGNVIAAKKTYANISLINWQEKYLRKLHMTALVGYLYRTLEEYEPEDELRRETKRYEAAKKHLSAEQLDTASKEHELRLAAVKTRTREIISTFLNRNFNYNPDRHLRGSHTENKADPERKSKYDEIKRTCSLSEQSQVTEDKIKSRQDLTYKYIRSHMLTTYQHAVDLVGILKSTLSVMLDRDIDLHDKQGIMFKKYKMLVDVTNDMKRVVDPLVAADTISAWKVDPPVDVFHAFDRYLTNHYEQLVDICTALYNEKRDMEYSVVFYDAFKTADAARNYIIQHEKEFKSEVFTIENNCVQLVGPFKENRQRIDFYNKNTEVLKRMMEQIESDHALGKDLIEKQVKIKKAKNIEEAGPDDPALTQYAKTMNVVNELGAKKILSREEQDKLVQAYNDAKSIKEEYEIPDDSIQVDMYMPVETEEGVSLKKSKFYTQAEAPLHLQKDSPFADKYQPKRADSQNLVDSYRTKVITGRHGEKMEIKVPVKHSEG